MDKITTTIRAYNFDLSRPEDWAAWAELKAKLANHPRCMESHGGNSHWQPKLDGLTVELETQWLYDNQWNIAPIPDITANGLRVFDWAMDYQPNHNPKIKRGHYLEQTDAMREIRRNRNKCGYCGHQEEAQRGLVFCDRCIDSEYLKESDLPLLRMHCVNESLRREIAPLTEAELAHLVPLFIQAQTHGSTERGKARLIALRERIEKHAAATITGAVNERDGMIWLMDRGINVGNVIYYSHTGKFSFGWRKPMSAGEVSALLDVISEFKWPYEIKSEDGKTLSAA